MSGRFKFILIGMLVLLIMVGALSLADQDEADSDILPTEIIPQNITGPIEPPDDMEPTKEKDIKP